MKRYAFFACLTLFALWSCNKPSDFGKEFVSGNNIPYELLDTFTLKAVSEPGDSIRTYVPGSTSLSMSNSMVGNLADADFGALRAEAFANFAVERIYNGSLAPLQVDSAVWEVYYDADSTNQYGDLSAPMSLEVFRINEKVNTADTLYSNDSFTVEPAPVSGLYNFIPKPLPSDSMHLRFKLNDQFISFIKGLPDTTFKNSANVRTHFDGLGIKAAGETKALVRFNFINSKNRLMIYFKNAEGQSDSIKLLTNVNCLRQTYFRHNYQGSRFQKSIDQPGSDSLLFLQSMGGPRIKVTLPDLSYLKGDGLNFAELELTIAKDNGTYYSMPSQIWLYKKNSSDQLAYITDGLIAVNNGLTASYGGTPEEFVANGQSVFRYKIRLPKHLTDYIDGEESNELYISVLNAGSVPARVILNGPGTAANPIKLKLIVSKII